ncbi:N-acetylmuramoyl-L-alanine amidase [Streptomyces sp. 1331.2]|uniref:N-acetylmuramoyl-L-alanine amidase n=1 Tax=Streptomyces sp. 1331.2 TaxID=1938835 RepID=UPI000BCC4352|nr:peptidoglycan-binding protein [Streptomyces sp. 1331.2]SOB83129.1 Peptidoglycan-binding (PGRP) domain of peptidoglycan hydrolases-containing protein [Streptomyces sp. 1331.2]
MSWYPAAQRMELQPESDAQPAISPTQFIVHSIAAPWSPGRVFEYWRDSTNLESHFAVGFDGSLAQFIGTQTRADANAAANRRSDGTGAVSLESASNTDHSDPWTPAQVEQIVQLGVWLHHEHGIPLRICRTPDDPGYGYHGLFRAWSTSGTACPGPARIEQWRDVVFPAIVARATGTEPAPDPQPAPAPEQPATPARHRVTIAGLEYGYGAHGPHVRQVGEALIAAGHGSHYAVGPDEDWRDPDTLNYAEWQRQLGYTGSDADGVPGEQSLRRLLGGTLPGEQQVVDLDELIAAARRDPDLPQGGTTYPAAVRPVEAALAAEGLLDSYAGDGSFGSRTVAAYAAWQRQLGYSGPGADGIPGLASLAELARRHGFTVR